MQTAFARNLPYFFTRQVDVPTTQRVPSFQTRNILTADPTGVVAPNIMDHGYAVEYTQTWSGGLQYELLPSTIVVIAPSERPAAFASASALRRASATAFARACR